MQLVGMNNVQSRMLFLPLGFMKKNCRGQTGTRALWFLRLFCLLLYAFAPLCLCPFVPLPICAFAPLCLCAL